MADVRPPMCLFSFSHMRGTRRVAALVAQAMDGVRVTAEIQPSSKGSVKVRNHLLIQVCY